MSKKTFKNLIMMNQKLNNIRFVKTLVASTDENTKVKNNNKKQNKKANIMMAFSVPVQAETKTNASFKRYVGVRNVKVLAINPTVEELNKIYSGEQKEIEYRGKDRNEEEFFNIVFILQSVGDDANIYRKYFTLKKKQVVSKTGKILCIDAYGRTAYIDKSLYDAHDIPEYAKKLDPTANIGISKDYRAAMYGEKDLIAFIKAYIGIKDRIYQDGKFVNNPNMNERECNFSNIGKIYNGDLTELKSAFEPAMVNNDTESPQTVKVMLGVKTAEDGKVSNVIYPTVFLPWHSRPNRDTGLYYDFNKALTEDATAEQPRHLDTKYSAKDAEEWSVSPSEMQEMISDRAIEQPINDAFQSNSLFGSDDLPF